MNPPLYDVQRRIFFLNGHREGGRLHIRRYLGCVQHYMMNMIDINLLQRFKPKLHNSAFNTLYIGITADHD